MYKGIYFNKFENSYIPEILKELYIEKVYSPYLNGKTELVILDIGANIGLFSFYATDFASKIYAIEPSKEHIDVMKYMLKQNDIKNVVPLQYAISNKDGEATFYHSENVTMYSLKKEVSTTNLTETVKTIRFDTLFREQKIEMADFVKLDIEGSEVDVIGGDGFYNIKDKIKVIVVEYHNWSGRNPSQITTTLSDYGFKVNRIPADATLFVGTRE